MGGTGAAVRDRDAERLDKVVDHWRWAPEPAHHISSSPAQPALGAW